MISIDTMDSHRILTLFPVSNIFHNAPYFVLRIVTGLIHGDGGFLASVWKRCNPTSWRIWLTTRLLNYLGFMNTTITVEIPSCWSFLKSISEGWSVTSMFWIVNMKLAFWKSRSRMEVFAFCSSSTSVQLIIYTLFYIIY